MTRVVPASSLALAASYELTFSLDHPIVGWKNLASGFSATTADANYPASNLINPATHLKWKAGAANSPPDTYIYLTTSIMTTPNLNSPADPTTSVVDYVAIARHNLATLGCPVSIGYFNTASPPVWVELISETTLTDNGPVLFRFTAQQLTSISVRLRAFDASSPPVAFASEIAVIYTGKLLVLPRKIYQGLTPINYARTAKITNGRSEAGQFLGRIVMQEFVKDTVPLSLIDPTYYQTYIDTFLDESKESPFFFAYRPQSQPTSLGYCHMTNDPMPTNEAPHGLIAMQWEMTGIV